MNPPINIHHLRKTFTPEEISLAISALSSKEAELLLNDWRFLARPEQLLPQEHTGIGYLVMSGRGWGKTRTGAEWVLERAREGKGPIALIGQTVADVRDVMLEGGPSSIIQVAPKDFKPIYEPSKRRLTFPNGVTATTFSGDSPDQLRGFNSQTTWIDELPKFQDADELYTQMMLGLRIGSPKVLITTTPLPTPLMKRIYEDPSYYVVRGKTYDNIDNLSDAFLKEVKDKYEGTRIGRQEVYGELVWDNDQALFTSTNLDKYRLQDPPQLESIVVAVDPAVTTNKSSDDTGIVVCGIDQDFHGYVLGVHTGKYTPQQWASRVSALCEQYDTPYVVVEVNQGGDLVTETIRQHSQHLIVVPVRATKGKMVRMEPISLLAEQGRVHLVGSYPKLEEELCMYTGSGKSPDSYDAMCWGLTHLMLGKKRHVKTTEFSL